jgi:hypothetical protein
VRRLPPESRVTATLGIIILCFEVLINGTKVCTAGVGEFGLISAILSWVKCAPEECLDEGREWRLGHPNLEISGLANREHLR